MYGELFFTSTEECNDPFDSKSFYEFPNDVNRWAQLFKFVLGKLQNLYPQCANIVASEVCRNCPLTFEEASSLDYYSLFFQVTNKKDQQFALAAANGVEHVFNLYKPPTRYFVSFSRVNNEPLMWSHYAMRHEGFCLVFRSHDGMLKQNPLLARTSVQRKTPAGMAPSMGYGIPDGFLFQDISYVPVVNHLCAFQLFPQAVAGRIQSEEERIEIAHIQANQYLQKHPSWSYESESRLTLSIPTPWLFGDRFEYSVQERIFNFEQTQLVGIIFGARMSDDHKNRVYQILDDRKEQISKQVNYKRVIFDFLVQQAQLSSRHREIEIHPAKLITLLEPIEPNDKKFEQKYQQWIEGWGMEIDGPKGSLVQIRN